METTDKPHDPGDRMETTDKPHDPGDPFTVVALGSNGAPDLEFVITGAVVRAGISGAKLYAELERSDSVRLRITDADGLVLCDVTLHPLPDKTVTENLRDVAAALLWSHWRWVQMQPTSTEATPQ